MDRMSRFDPSFAGLDSGWYEESTDDNYGKERLALLEWWDSTCDSVLEKYLIQHGFCVELFDYEIRDEIKRVHPSPGCFPRYFCYFIKSRILHHPDWSTMWHKDYRKRATLPYKCKICAREQYYEDTHSSIIRRTKGLLPLCSSCWGESVGLIPLEARNGFSDRDISILSKRIQDQKCPCCNACFNIAKGIKWRQSQGAACIKSELKPRIAPWTKGARINPYIEICPDCLYEAFEDSPTQNVNHKEEELKAIKAVSDLISGIPDQGVSVLGQAKTLDGAVSIVRILKNLRTFEEITKDHGSWFKCLIAADVLEDGTRRGTFGTMVLANDGHECRSLGEKEIDDLFYEYGIEHETEPRYPGANYRADWLIKTKSGAVYVEYFGLIGNKEYEKRMKAKKRYAKKHGLNIVSFVPKDFSDIRYAFKKKILCMFQ